MLTRRSNLHLEAKEASDVSSTKSENANAGTSSVPQRRRTVKPPINFGAANRKDKSAKVQTPSRNTPDNEKKKETDTVEIQNSTSSTIAIVNKEVPADIKKSSTFNSPSCASPKDIPQRRRIVKPAINVMVANRKNKLQEKSGKSITVQKESPLCSFDRILSPSGRKSVDILKSTLSSPKSKQSTDSLNNLIPTNVIVPNVLTLNVNSASDTVANNPVFNDECSFDPIIPLPSANKTNRPKLKPAPRFTLRRNSFQGSASEAEEAEVPPSPPPATASTTVSSLSSTFIPTPSSVIRVRHTSTSLAPTQQHKSRITHRHKVGANIPHQARTMKDLIFYNPPNNAIQPKDEEARKDLQINFPTPAPEVTENPEVEESDAMPVPQVKLGPNGEIVIDEQSLVIETSEAVRSRQRIQQLSFVWDGGMGGGGGRYMRGKRCKEWSHKETLRFYRALHTMGTDFSLMLSLFPGRTRRDLKVKFKKEEKTNGHLVDKVLMNPLQFNMDELEQDAKRAMEEEEREREKLKEGSIQKQEAPAAKKKRPRTNLSLAAQSIGEECLKSYDSSDMKPPRVTNKKLRSDYLADDRILPSPARSLLPPHLEQGSLVLLQEIDGLKAYRVEGESLQPLHLSQENLQIIATKLGQNVSHHTP